MAASIYAIGTAQPAHCLSQELAAKMVRSFMAGAEEDLQAFEEMLHRSGVVKRASVVLENEEGDQTFYAPAKGPGDQGPTTGQRMKFYAREAGPLAAKAAGSALEASGCRPEQITHLVTVSCTGFCAPGLDAFLVRCLGLSPNVGRLHLGFMACHAAINGLMAAKALVECDPSALVLICAVELCTLHFQHGFEAAQMFANTLFADGAAAVVVGPEKSAPPGAWRLLATGSILMPDSADAMTWEVGDHGFRMSLEGIAPHLISGRLRGWLKDWLAGCGLSLEQIGSWGIHPGGVRLASAVARLLKLPRTVAAASNELLAECGNMSSPTVLFILDRLQRTGAARPCVLLAFGPGLTAEAALVG